MINFHIGEIETHFFLNKISTAVYIYKKPYYAKQNT